ncbi:MAG: hypothetical protein AABZ55_02825 [Bdellovibrionota bacterium]
MLKFGKIPPRLLESFGIAGVLGEGAKIFYSSLFSPRHIGRVSDLLAAKFLELKLDDLKLRAILIFTYYEAFRGQGYDSTSEKRNLNQALVLECGQDEEKIAIGMSFNLKEQEWPDVSGISHHIESGSPTNPLEKRLLEMYRHADRLIVRYQADVRRIEVISLLGIPGKIDEEFLISKQPTQLVNLGKTPQETPENKDYTEVGDLDYAKLLEEDTPGKKDKPISIGDILARSVRQVEQRVENVKGTKEEKSSARIKGSKENQQSEDRFQGEGERELSESRIKGNEEEVDHTNKRILGDKESSGRGFNVIQGGEGSASEDREINIHSGGSSDSEHKSQEGEKQKLYKIIATYKDRINELENEIRRLKLAKGLNPASTPGFDQETDIVLSGTRSASNVNQSGSKLMASLQARKSNEQKGDYEYLNSDPSQSLDSSLLKSSQSAVGKAVSPNQLSVLVPAGDSESNSEVEPENSRELLARSASSSKSKGWLKKIWPFRTAESEEIESEPETFVLQSQISEAKPYHVNTQKPAAPTTPALVEDVVVPTEKLVEEIQTGGLDRVISKAKSEVTAVHDQIADKKTKRWVSNLISELVKEKAMLNETARTLQTSYKAREMEFRRAEQSIKEELRRRDETLKQKTHAQEKLKDQISQLSFQLDKLKNAAASDVDGHFKQKHEMSQKMLTLSRDENQRLTDRIEDLRGQLASVQLASTKRSSAGSEIASLVAQNERMQKQVEEYKKTNIQIMERFNQTKREKTASNATTDEMRKKVELSTKQVIASKRETDKLQLKLDEIDRENERLKIELTRAQLEIKKFKQDGGGKTGPASAA